MTTTTVCIREELWYYHIFTCFAVYFGGMVVIVSVRLIWVLSGCQDRYVDTRWSGYFRYKVAPLIYGDHTYSKIYVLINRIMNFVSILLFFIDSKRAVRNGCGSFRADTIQRAWMFVLVSSLVDFYLRLLASKDRLTYWLSTFSVVDIFSLAPLLVNCYLDRNWIGLKFLRLLYLFKLPEALEISRVLKSTKGIRMCQVLAVFTGVWLTSSGFIHVVANTGDPHQRYVDYQYLGYWEAVYWLLVTMSTVGYGDFVPTTDIGRVFVTLFIMSSFVMFTKLIPELADTMSGRKNYTKPGSRLYNDHHVLVVGNVTHGTISSFAKNFLGLMEGMKKNTDIIFINRNVPDLELQAFFRRRNRCVVFTQDSIFDLACQPNGQIAKAEACLILKDHNEENPDHVDFLNMMRITAVKALAPDMKIVAQINFHQNKSLILDVPSWKWDTDELICLDDFIMSILATSCLVPGFSTFISNLFSYRRNQRSVDTDSWISSYRYGASQSLFVAFLPSSLNGLSLYNATRLCYEKLNLLLIGVKIRSEADQMITTLNMGSCVQIEMNTIGYFIAHSQKDIEKLFDVPKPTIRKWSKGPSTSPLLQYVDGAYKTRRGSSRVDPFEKKNKIPVNRLRAASMASVISIDDFHDGRYYYERSKSIEECSLSFQQLRDMELNQHVIVFLQNGPRRCLWRLISRLRCSAVSRNHIPVVLLVGPIDNVLHDWPAISRFPSLYFHECSDPYLARNLIICLRVHTASACIVLPSANIVNMEGIRVDESAIRIAKMISSLLQERGTKHPVPFNNMDDADSYMFSHGIQRCIAFVEDEHTWKFLSHNVPYSPNDPQFLTPPYASGELFPAGALDALVSMTFLYPDLLSIVKELIGGFYKTVYEGIKYEIHHPKEEFCEGRYRQGYRLALVCLNHGHLALIKHDYKYGRLVLETFDKLKILILGLYRLMDKNSGKNGSRFVFTNPPFDTTLHCTDQVYIILPPGGIAHSESCNNYDTYVTMTSEIFPNSVPEESTPCLSV